MKYFIDTEFVEEPGSIELISIGIVAEDGRKYYAISKEFDIKKAWNRYQIEHYDETVGSAKKYWIRDNVLKSIFDELLLKYNSGAIKQNYLIGFGGKVADPKFTRRNLARLIKKYGVSRDQMAGDILIFVSSEEIGVKPGCLATEWLETIRRGFTKPEFYAYYADYDWVVFCWIFGRMIDLPKGFPQYCIDLKQMMQEYGLNEAWKEKKCPDPHGEHNALFDAKWNKLLYERICEHKVNSEMIFALKYANYKVYKNANKDLRYGDFSEVRAFFNEEIKYDIEFLNLGTKNCQS